MKTVLRRVFLVGAIALASAAQAAPYVDWDPVTGNINVGRVRLFTVLAAGDANFLNDTFTGPSLVRGNIGIGGSAKFSMSDGDVYGDLYLHTGASWTRSGPATLHGSVHNNADTEIDGALQDAQDLSDAAFMDTGSGGPHTAGYASLTAVNITNTSQSIVINGDPFEKVVLNLTSFKMSQGTFTLNGFSNTTFIVNVKNGGAFTINNSMILLSGGVTASNVLFNIRGSTGQVSLNQGTQMSGILLARYRQVTLSGGKVFGRVIADQFSITSGGQVISQ